MTNATIQSTTSTEAGNQEISALQNLQRNPRERQTNSSHKVFFDRIQDFGKTFSLPLQGIPAILEYREISNCLRLGPTVDQSHRCNVFD